MGCAIWRHVLAGGCCQDFLWHPLLLHAPMAVTGSCAQVGYAVAEDMLPYLLHSIRPRPFPCVPTCRLCFSLPCFIC